METPVVVTCAGLLTVMLAACTAQFTVRLPHDGELACHLQEPKKQRHVIWRHWRYDDDDVLDEATEEQP
jgi:hypothetical protein